MTSLIAGVESATKRALMKAKVPYRIPIAI